MTHKIGNFLDKMVFLHSQLSEWDSAKVRFDKRRSSPSVWEDVKSVPSKVHENLFFNINLSFRSKFGKLVPCKIQLSFDICQEKL